MKKLFSSLLTMILVLAMTFSMATTVKADNYTYTVRIYLGGNGTENAAFNLTDSNVIVTGSTKSDVKKTSDDVITITGLEYGSYVTVNTNSLVTLTPDENGYTKYYVKGLRKSGSESTGSAFEVTGDQDYVVAYGVGAVVPYTVNYVDADGNTLLESETFYGPAGEELYVSYRYISGYTPNTYNYHTSKLEENTVFTFTYTVGGFSLETTTYTTETGETVYTYVTVPGATVTTPAAGGAGGAGAAAAGGNANAAAGADNGANAGDNTTIADEATPEQGPADVTEIGDEDVALAGGEDAGFTVPVFAYIILAVAAATLIFAIIVLNKRKKAAVVKEEAPEQQDK